MKLSVLFVLVLWSGMAKSQMIGRIQLIGQIEGAVERESITIINESTEQSVKTDHLGRFEISARADDTLMIASIFIIGRRIGVSRKHIETKKIIIYAEPNVNPLHEVTITNLNAVELGILDRPAKKYTPAERRLKTAGDFKPIHLVGILGGSLQVDPILNAISGRTKKLKKQVGVERNEKMLQQLDEILSSNDLQTRLEIPPDYIKGYIYFLIDDENFAATFKSGNPYEIELMLITLAPKYLKTL